MTGNPTLTVYDRMAEDYRKMASGVEFAGLALFLKVLRPGSRVLDLGCGPGHESERIAAAGHDVLAVDGSAEMVAMAQGRPGVTARQALFEDIPTLGTFDGIWASFSLLHAPRGDFPRHLSQLHAAATPGAPFGLAMKLGDGEAPDSLGRHYTYHAEEDLRDQLAGAGFTPVDMRQGESAGLAGHPEPWIFLLSHA
ncbi:class I SAM-dependent DNA methyltransferase [Psychromarinibacter halotolerans]|uniref:Class I SAM-dependent DNA methyltransferase n=1 Tax=Psychromarinibacter halotolerans TaxID=1775175 RepID=A0ABV7GQM8_9RHOB|nr:class I SAM-dependent methyltransferase [Psychromarinibacter halotolerans]MDF0595485.1 class I SAM-dependent methyltransferase [Psychromarinibacter halotolerans]